MAPRTPEHLNGGWPDLEVVEIKIPELPEDASPAQTARAYASVTLQLAWVLPKMVQALEFLYGALIGAKGQLTQANALAARVEKLEQKIPSVPPVRAETASSVDLMRDARSQVADKLQEFAKRTPGKLLTARPEELEAVISEIFSEKLLAREQELRNRANEERLAAIDEAEKKAKDLAAKNAAALLLEADKAKLKFKMLLRYGLIGAFLTALATAAGTAAYTTQKAKAEGILEERLRSRSLPPATAPATVAPNR